MLIFILFCILSIFVIFIFKKQLRFGLVKRVNFVSIIVILNINFILCIERSRGLGQFLLKMYLCIHTYVCVAMKIKEKEAMT